MAPQIDLNDIALQLKYPIGYRIKDYQSAFGRTFDDFDLPVTWTAGGNITITANTSEIKRGKAAVKATTSVGSGGNINKSINKYIGITDQQLRLWVYCHGEPTMILKSLVIYLSSTTNFSKYFMQEVTWQIAYSGWNLVEMQPSDAWDNVGGEFWGNKFLSIRFAITPKTGQSCALTFDAMDYGAANEPRIVFSFDDGYKNAFTTAFPIMESFGIKGVSYVISDSIGASVFMTLDQLHELYDAGWDISNHSFNHMQYNDKSVAEIQSSIVNGQNFLLQNGFIRSAKHFAIPYGTYNNNVAAAIENAGVITARTSLSQLFIPGTVPQKRLPSMYLANTTTFETARGWVDDTVRKGKTLIFMFHSIVDSPVNEYSWATTDFQALVKYIVERNIPVVTMSDWYNGLNR